MNNPERSRRVFTVRLGAAVVIGVLYLVGIIGHLHPGLRDLVGRLTPWVLALSGLGVLALSLDLRTTRSWIGIGLILVGCFAIEAAGVATGLIFGTYHYGDALGFKILGVPPVIALNWVLIIVAGLRAASKLPPVWRVVLVGIFAVAFDLVLEQAVLRLGYWTWYQGTIPVQNYVAWGLVGLLGAALATSLRLRIEGWLPVILAAAQTVFMAVLGLAL